MNQLFHQYNLPYLLEHSVSVGTWVDFHTAAIVFQVFSGSVLVTECHMPREQGEDTEPKIRHACHLSQDFSGFFC